MIDPRCAIPGAGLAALAVGFAASLHTASAQAQGASNVLEEVIVTARRREESLQEIPVSVMAFTAEELELQGIEQLADLNSSVPNFSILGAGASGDGGEAEMVMRAVEGVGVYIDGIWQANTFGLFTNEFVDIERVEVLRGPQGTLYGKNTTGGAINIVTQLPAEEFGASFSATMGSFERRDIKLGVDVPLSDTVKTKLTAISLDREGFVTQIPSGRKLGDVNRDIFRGDLTWTPNDNFDMRVIYQVEDVEENGSPRVLGNVIENGVPFGQSVIRTQYFTEAGRPILNSNQRAGFPGGSIGEYQSTSEVDAIGNLSDKSSATIHLNWNINDSLAFRSITGYQEDTRRIYTDNDSTEILSINDDEYHHHWQSTQEFQLIGGNDRVNWVGGSYFWDENFAAREIRYTFHEFRTGELDFAPVVAACIENTVPDSRPGQEGSNTACSGTERPGDADTLDGQETNGWAIYGDLDIVLTDRWTLTLGFRHQEEDLESWAQDPSSPVTFRPPGPPDSVPVPAVLPNSPIPGTGTISVPGTRPYIGPDPGVLYAGIPSDRLWSGVKGVDPGMGAGFIEGLTASDSFESNTGRISLRYRPRDELMVYGSYSEGFTAGGANIIFPLGLPVISSFLPEELENLELGLRSDWMDGRLRLNVTLFAGDWTNIQLAETQRDPVTGAPLPGTTTGNAAAAEVSGSEIELTIVPTDAWRFDINVATLDTEYTEINEGTRDVRAGDVFQQAPELTYTLAAQWNGETGNGGAITAGVNYWWTDDFVRVRERDRQVGEPSYGLLGANLAYTPPSGDWQIQLFGTNLTDEWYKTSGFTSTGFGFDFATLGPPREFGVRLNFFLD